LIGDSLSTYLIYDFISLLFLSIELLSGILVGRVGKVGSEKSQVLLFLLVILLLGNPKLFGMLGNQ